MGGGFLVVCRWDAKGDCCVAEPIEGGDSVFGINPGDKPPLLDDSSTSMGSGKLGLADTPHTSHGVDDADPRLAPMTAQRRKEGIAGLIGRRWLRNVACDDRLIFAVQWWRRGSYGVVLLSSYGDVLGARTDNDTAGCVCNCLAGLSSNGSRAGRVFIGIVASCPPGADSEGDCKGSRGDGPRHVVVQVSQPLAGVPGAGKHSHRRRNGQDPAKNAHASTPSPRPDSPRGHLLRPDSGGYRTCVYMAPRVWSSSVLGTSGCHLTDKRRPAQSHVSLAQHAPRRSAARSHRDCSTRSAACQGDGSRRLSTARGTLECRPGHRPRCNWLSNRA